MDYDGDGHLDLISGCFEGGGYLVRGMGKGKFAKPVPIKDKSGGKLRLGQFWNHSTKKWDKVKSSNSGNLGISMTLVDWDADGDLDLLLGSFEGQMFVRRNEGSARQPSYVTENTQVYAAGKALFVPSKHAMPIVADWDQDGLWDLLTGSSGGGVYWYRNCGKLGQPEFAAAVQLVGRGTTALDQPGRRTQVAVGDYDGDGMVDLLVGDYRSSVSRTEKDARGRAKRSPHGWVWLYRRIGRGKARR